MSHTPAPWTLVKDRVGLTIVTACEDGSIPLNSRIVADIKNVSDADVAVIVAAPELLAALRQQTKAIEELLSEFVSKKRAANWGIINDAGISAGLAIRKAEGKS